MKRITVWIDTKNESVEQIREKLKKFLAEMRLRYKIVEICELREPGDDK